MELVREVEKAAVEHVIDGSWRAAVVSINCPYRNRSETLQREGRSATPGH